LAGCDSRQPIDGHLSLDPAAVWQEGELTIESGIDFEPTAPMREALERGVDIQLKLTIRVSRRLGPMAWLAERRQTTARIRFLPLTEQWQLETEDVEQNYPRLWLLLEALSRPRDYPTGLRRESLRDDSWQVQIRVAVDRSALPAPMHLPSLFSPDWQLGGTWHTWQFDPS